ncbi:hypothetical protein KC19_VG122300 [Ceratodon purpureus]|uniref:Uncharacterized protein n=1 Tax=Ceratodon purpureus TaxID=3225 RepID=A0A8T0HPJ1_CERPU|nr:hypothetical protein KC19_VG122300 [Ceratodon purpureus]
MRGVDVTDQLRGNYCSQLRCHKWWIKLFHFIVDQTMVNAYVTWVKEMEALGLRVGTHLGFKIAVGRHLIEDVLQNRRREGILPQPRQRRPPPTYAHFRSTSKRKCVVCGNRQRWYCRACGHKWMCRERCFYDHHCRLNGR